jgi:hypothetical protein
MFSKVIWCLDSFYKDVISFDEHSNSSSRLIFPPIIDLKNLSSLARLLLIYTKFSSSLKMTRNNKDERALVLLSPISRDN